MATSDKRPPRFMRRHLAVVHPQHHSLLVQRGEDGALRLPFLDEPSGDPRQVGGIAEHLGTDLPLASLGELAFVWFGPDQRADHIDAEYLILCEPVGTPADEVLARYEWVSDAEQIDLHAEPAEALKELVDWLAVRAADSPLNLLPPHCLPGATAALADAVASAIPTYSGANQFGGVCPERGLKQLQAWVLSNVWLSEDMVVKATTPLWPQEPAVTALLHDIAPHTVPEVLALGAISVPGSARASSWMATKRYPVLEPEPKVSTEAVLRAIAQLQAAALTRGLELRAAGVPKRGPLEVAADLNVLWEEAAATGLTDDEVARLPSLDAWLTRRLRRLAKTAPLLLTHGDLHTGNVLLTPADDPLPAHHGEDQAPTEPAASRPKLIVFDWTDAALAWPGVDLQTLTDFGLDRDPQPGELDRLKREYVAVVLEAFTGAGQTELLGRIKDSLDAGTELALAYHAVTYAHIIRSVPRRQKPFVGSEFLARAVRRLMGQLETARD